MKLIPPRPPSLGPANDGPYDRDSTGVLLASVHWPFLDFLIIMIFGIFIKDIILFYCFFGCTEFLLPHRGFL